MKQRRRFGLSAEQKSDVWRRWKAGQTLHEIGRAFGKLHKPIRCVVSRHGGIVQASKGAPNILLILTNDVGFCRLGRAESTRYFCRLPVLNPADIITHQLISAEISTGDPATAVFPI